MLTRLSAITPRPTQRFIPAFPLYRLRLSPCRRLTTLMRPSHPVRHFWPLRNQRFFCSRLRSGLLVERLGMQTRLTPFAFPPSCSWRSRMRHLPRPGAECDRVLPDGLRRLRSADPNRWDADRRLRSRSQSDSRSPAVSPSCRIRWLAGLAFADDLRRGLEQAENLA